MKLDYNGDTYTKSFSCDHLGCTNTSIAYRGEELPVGWEYVEKKLWGKPRVMYCGKCLEALKRVDAYRAEWKAWEEKCRIRRYGAKETI